MIQSYNIDYQPFIVCVTVACNSKMERFQPSSMSLRTNGLQEAVKAGDIIRARKEVLIDPESWKVFDQLGRTVLHLAFQIDQKRNRFEKRWFYEGVIIKMMEIFLKLGLYIDARAVDGKTALFLAVELKMKHVITFLVSNGADVTLQDYFGDNIALAMVRGMNYFDSVISNTLCSDMIRNGIDVDAKNYNGQTAFRLSLARNLCSAKIIASYTKEINYTNEDGQNIIHIMMKNADFDHNCINTLLGKGVDINVIDKNGQTPIHIAARSAHVPKRMFFTLAYMVDVNARDNDGNTVLHIAAQSRDNNDFCKELIRLGASVNQKGLFDYVPVQVAAVNKNLELLRLLQDMKVDFTIRTSTGDTLLHLLCSRKKKTPNSRDVAIMVELLIRNGCEVNDRDDCNQTSLHIAANRGCLTIVGALLNYGAKVNARNNESATPLHCAQVRGSKKLVQTLIDAGASVNITDFSGHLPLGWAIFYDNQDGLKCLLKNGADINDIALSPSHSFQLAKARNKCWMSIVKHCLKLEAAKLPIAQQLKDEIDFNAPELLTQFQKYLVEIELLKKVCEVGDKSCYELLHMDPCKRFKYRNTLKAFASGKLFAVTGVKIIHYSNLIQSIHKQTIDRRLLMQYASDAMYIVTQGRLPYLCINTILSNLSNSSLNTVSSISLQYN